MHVEPDTGSSSIRPAAIVGATPEPNDGETAEDREKARARTRGVAESELDDLAKKTAWYVSNRVDDRVVLWERDPRHPNGEVFLAGGTPARAFRTTNIQRLEMSGEILEVPEPNKTATDADGNEVANRKMPLDVGVDPGLTMAAQPGHEAPLGRKLDKDLWSDKARDTVAKRQAQFPGAVPAPAGAIVPRQSEVDRPG